MSDWALGSHSQWHRGMKAAQQDFAERQADYAQAAKATQAAQARVKAEEESAARAAAADEPARRKAAQKAMRDLILVAWAREHHSRETGRLHRADARAGIAADKVGAASLAEEPDGIDQDAEENSRMMRP